MIVDIFNSKAKKIAVLIDPDKTSPERAVSLVKKAEQIASFVLVGGSLIKSDLDATVQTIKAHTSLPVLLFPGHYSHISKFADGILLLSLISGRNPDYLIGHQMIAAPYIKQYGLEVISTGYMLIESGITTSVEYMSNTRPIPFDKSDIAVSTALAGQMMGCKAVYLEAGSGAARPVSTMMIDKVRQNIDIPIIVGGGITTPDAMDKAFKAGADIVVIGTILEREPSILNDFAKVLTQFNN